MLLLLWLPGPVRTLLLLLWIRAIKTVASGMLSPCCWLDGGARQQQLPLLRLPVAPIALLLLRLLVKTSLRLRQPPIDITLHHVAMVILLQQLLLRVLSLLLR